MSAAEGKRKSKAAADSKRRKKKVVGDALDNDRSTIQKRRGLFAKDLMMQRSVEASAKRGKLETEDLIHLVRKDPVKFGRVKELMAADAEIKAAKKTFEEDDEIDQGKISALATTKTGS